MYLIKFQALVLLQRISDGSLDDVEFPFDLQEIKKEPDDQELQTQNILPGADINDIDRLDDKEDIGNIKVEENNAEIKECIKKVDNDTNQLDISNEKEVSAKHTIVKGNSKLNDKYNAKPKKKKVVKKESDENCDTKKDGKPRKKLGRPKQDITIERVTNKNLAICKLCNKEVYGLVTHHRTHHKNIDQKSPCLQCDQVFENKTALYKHNAKVHEAKPCSICGEMISKYYQKQHFVTFHTESAPCPKCGKICKSKGDLARHIKDEHEKYPCPHCGDMLSTRRAATHMKTKHTPNEDLKFKCDICGKGFISNGKLQNHVNIHTGAKPYKCKFCNATFGDSANYRAHERAHLGHKRGQK